MKTASTFFSLVFMTLTGGAFAADLHSLSDQVVKSCDPDIKRLCSDIQPGSGRIAACLRSKSNKLSDPCKKSVSTLNAEVDARYDKMVNELKAACSDDMAKYCGRVPAGEGRMLACLTGRRGDLSKNCTEFMNGAAVKINEMLQ